MKSSSDSMSLIRALLALALLGPNILGMSLYGVVCPEDCCDCAEAGSCCKAGAELVNEDQCGLEIDQDPGVESRPSPTTDAVTLVESSEEVSLLSSWSGRYLHDPPAVRDDVFYLYCSLLI